MGNSCTSVFPNTHEWEQQEQNKTKRQTKMVEERREYGKKQSWHDQKKSDGLSHPNQNIIIINKIW